MKPPVAYAEMLIRRPVADVFAAVADGAQITRFWLSRASGPLEEGKTVQWDFMVEGATAQTTVRRLERDRSILIEWEDQTTAEWTFTEHADGTVLRVENTGFAGSDDELVSAVVDATQGFTIVLSDLKVYLESGASPGLCRDKAQIIEESM